MPHNVKIGNTCVTTDIAHRHDIVVTEKLETKKMTRKGKKRIHQKAGLNKSILDVGFGTLNKMIAYKVEAKGGLVFFLPTCQLKPSQRCPKCGTVHKEWAELSTRYHICECTFEMPRDKTSTVVMYQALLDKQPGFGMNLDNRGCFSSTSKTGKRKHTGSMKQLGLLEATEAAKYRWWGDRNPVRLYGGVVHVQTGLVFPKPALHQELQHNPVS